MMPCMRPDVPEAAVPLTWACALQKLYSDIKPNNLPPRQVTYLLHLKLIGRNASHALWLCRPSSMSSSKACGSPSLLHAAEVMR